MVTENDFWSVKYQEACIDIQAANVRLVMAYGAKIFKDGDRWYVLIGEDLQSGQGAFGDSISMAFDEMLKILREAAKAGVVK